MAQYSVTELVDIVFCYGLANENSAVCATLYNDRYPLRRHPSPRTIRKIIERFQETGSVTARPRQGRPTTVANDDTTTVILATVAANPNISCRAIAGDVGCSRSAVQRVLHANKFHPYRLHCHQELHGNDFNIRAEYCNWVLTEIEKNHHFIENVMWSDEAQFSRNGTVNRNNMHYWATENPRWLREVAHQVNWRCNVWCGIYKRQIIGPVFYDGTLTGQRYSDIILTNTVEEFVDNLPLAHLNDMWFQHDGAPPHYAQIVKEQLCAVFGDKWIGRGGPVVWPPRSPDLTPLDFFLWGHIKDVVYQTPPQSLDDLKQRITVACAAITVQTLEDVHKSTHLRVQLCLGAEGQQFEHFLD